MTTPHPGSDASPVDPPAREALPLSARQSLLWLDDRLYPDARYHNLVHTIEIRGALDVPRFAQAFAEVVATNDALRLAVDSHQARQFYLDVPPPPLSVTALDPGQLDSFLAERSVRLLNSGGLLWDAVLLELGPDHHVFYFCQDHIVTDGLSSTLLVRNLEDRYLQRPVAATASFRDYLRSEAEGRESANGEKQQAYWDKKVAGGGAPLRPYGLVRADKSAALERVRFYADPALVQGLLELTRHEPFRTLSAPLSRLVVIATALCALLHRVTGNQEILLGVPFGNRSPRFARTMGLLMEQLFLRVSIDEGETIASLAHRVRDELHAALRNGQSCVSNRGMDYVTLNMLPILPTQFAGLPAKVKLTPAPTLGGAGAGEGDLRDSLGLQVVDFADGSLELAFDFHKATFNARTQARLQSQFLRVLEALTHDRNTPLDVIALTDEDERAFLLQAAAGRDPGEAAPDLVARFTENAQRRATHTAVVGPDITLSYAELDALTNRLAHRLRSLGVERESRVGVALPRGAGELAALLATLKAGGAYVPVDPTHPVERVRVILEDAAPQVLVAPSDSPLRAALPEGAVFLPLDDLTEATLAFDASPLAESAPPEQLAYILFTSGSTGRPKGVEVPRGAFANFLRSMAHTPGLGESDRLLAVTTTTFDIAGLELFLPLFVGATVVIADRDTATDPRRLRARLATEPVTVMQATPATWRLLIEAGYEGDGRLRMFIGGEALAPELAQELLRRGSELWNLYGPTETTVWSSLDRVHDAAARITIGRPIDRTQVYVLDPARQLVPAGVIGEIYIGGDGLARGYRKRPDLTTERFVAAPSGTPSDRLYRTGDLGRVLEDGRFECLGRIDHQIKLRGFRIELGEIEAAIARHPAVRAVVVVAREDSPGDKRLVAYVVAEDSPVDLVNQLRTLLRAAMPEYMVPAHFVALDALPLTPNGKIDRKVLPPPQADGVALPVGSYVAPSSDLEISLATVWASVLGVPRVGITDNFFDLGGNSLRVIKLIVEMTNATGVEMRLDAVFRFPTIAQLIASLGSDGAKNASVIVPLQPQGSEPPVFCLCGITIYAEFAKSLGTNQPVFGVYVAEEQALVEQSLKGEKIDISVEKLAEAYHRAVIRASPRGPYRLAGISFGGVLAMEVASRLRKSGATVELVMLLDTILPRGVRRNWRKWAYARARSLVNGHAVALLANKLSELRDRLMPRPATDGNGHSSERADAEAFARRQAAFYGVLGSWSTRGLVADFDVVLFHASTHASGPYVEFEEDYGWRHYVTGDFLVVQVTGGHLSIIEEPQVAHLGRVAQQCIEKAQRRTAAVTVEEPRSPQSAPKAEQPARKAEKRPVAADVTLPLDE